MVKGGEVWGHRILDPDAIVTETTSISAWEIDVVSMIIDLIFGSAMVCSHELFLKKINLQVSSKKKKESTYRKLFLIPKRIFLCILYGVRKDLLTYTNDAAVRNRMLA